MPKVDINSPYYPYLKVQTGNYNFKQYAEFPRLICDYLMDMPQGEYSPKDDNDRPRVRLWKYLYNDGERPLLSSLPSPEQKIAVIFNPDKPMEPPTDKGYRLIPQQYIKPAQDAAQTRIYVYLGRTISQDDYTYTASVVFDIFTHYTYELNTRSDEYSRSGAIVAALIEALDGVNITGVGTFSFSRRAHPDCCTKPIFDGNTNVGQELIIGLKMATTEDVDITEFSNMPFAVSGGTQRLI